MTAIDSKSVWAVHEQIGDDYVPFSWPEPVCTPLFSPEREIWGCDEDQVWAVKAIRRQLWGDQSWPVPKAPSADKVHPNAQSAPAREGSGR